MQVVEKIQELQGLSDRMRAEGRRIALVPTMGSLHAGHLALVAAAREHADQVWASIFVNPTQFDDPTDLARYPRALTRDLEACEAAGVDLAFVPTVQEMYAKNAETFVEVSRATQPLCGTSRPGHFRGVATVVTQLLLAAKPHVAVFGEKDFQQLVAIRRLVRDLHFDVRIVGVPTVREADGLALSSRNANLDPEARHQARVIPAALEAVERAVRDGECSSTRILARVRAEIARASRARIDYAELRDPDTLALVPERLEGDALLALAVVMEPVGPGGPTVRLIDNRVVRPAGAQESPR